MSRLMADQESRGGNNGDPCAGEEDSVMRVNLAEGCGAVNDETSRLLKKIAISYVEGSVSVFNLPGAASCAGWMLFCIRMIVQVIDSARPSFLFRAASGVVAGLSVATLTSCSLFSNRDGATIGYYLPLTVQLRSDPSIAGAQLTYQDACGQRQSLPIGAPLQEIAQAENRPRFRKGPDG